MSREIKRANKRKECKEQTNGKTKGPYVIFFRDRDVKFVNFFCAQVVFTHPFYRIIQASGGFMSSFFSDWWFGT